MTRLNDKGFTIPELISTIIVTGIFTGLILFFTISYWRYGSLLEADLDTLVSRLNAGDYLRENISASSGLIIQNGIPDTNTMNPDPSIASNLYWEPIHAVPGNTPVGGTGTTTPLVYFKRPSINTSGDMIMNGEQPYEDEYLIYLNGTDKTMMVRTLANPYASGNRLKTSCPPAIATNTCPADKTILDNLASVDMRFFSRTGNLIDYTSAVDSLTGEYIGPDFPTVEVIEFTINLEKKTLFQKSDSTFNSTIVRVALRND